MCAPFPSECGYRPKLKWGDLGKGATKTQKKVSAPNASENSWVFCEKIRLKSLLVLRTRGNHPTSRKSANDIAASDPLRRNRSFVVKFLAPLQELKWMLKFCSYMKFFLINRLQRYPSRVVYMFRQISYLGPKLRAFSGKENMTFVRKFI